MVRTVVTVDRDKQQTTVQRIHWFTGVRAADALTSDNQTAVTIADDLKGWRAI